MKIEALVDKLAVGGPAGEAVAATMCLVPDKEACVSSVLEDVFKGSRVMTLASGCKAVLFNLGPDPSKTALSVDQFFSSLIRDLHSDGQPSGAQQSESEVPDQSDSSSGDGSSAGSSPGSPPSDVVPSMPSPLCQVRPFPNAFLGLVEYQYSWLHMRTLLWF